MDQNVFAGQWKEIRGRVKLEFGKLTDDDLKQIDGRKDMLIGAIQKRYGYSLDTARKVVDEWAEKLSVH